jgi:hypothetical protein
MDASFNKINLTIKTVEACNMQAQKNRTPFLPSFYKILFILNRIFESVKCLAVFTEEILDTSCTFVPSIRLLIANISD